MSSVTPTHTGDDAELSLQGKVFGLVAEYDSPHDLLEAVKSVRAAGFTRIDTHTPFPVHGMDKAMGLPDTKLPWVVLAGGLTGTASAIALQWWMNGYDYTFRIGGKPFISYQAYVPIGFELTVLLSAFTTVLTLLAMCLLPRPYHPLFTHPRFARFSDDGFFISIESSDPRWDEAKARAVLEKAGGQEISIVRDIGDVGP
jgi:hypothetical protein